MVKFLHEDEDRVIVRLEDGTIVHILDEEIRLHVETEGKRRWKTFGFEDMLLMNDLICKIMQPVIDERNKLKDKHKRLLMNYRIQRALIGLLKKSNPLQKSKPS